jgi:hypothetical protein
VARFIIQVARFMDGFTSCRGISQGFGVNVGLTVVPAKAQSFCGPRYAPPSAGPVMMPDSIKENHVRHTCRSTSAEINNCFLSSENDLRRRFINGHLLSGFFALDFFSCSNPAKNCMGAISGSSVFFSGKWATQYWAVSFRSSRSEIRTILSESDLRFLWPDIKNAFMLVKKISCSRPECWGNNLGLDAVIIRHRSLMYKKNFAQVLVRHE